MALPAIDAFTGANGDPLSANWTILNGGWTTFSNYVYGTTGATHNLAYWDADTFADNQYAQAKYINIAGVYSGPAVRVAATRCYFAMVVTSTQINVERMDSIGTGATLQAIGSLSIASGDLIGLQAEGTTIRAYLNGVQVGTDMTDATYSSGSAGIVAYGTNAGIDDFEGGNLAAAVDTFRPSGTLAAGTWAAYPSGTLHGVTSDVADATYAQSSTGSGTDTLDLSFPAMGTPPAGTVTFYVRHAAGDDLDDILGAGGDLAAPGGAGSGTGTVT